MFFKHKYITAPTVTPQDAVIQAAKQLTDALKGIVPPPFSESGIDQIKKLSTIFNIWWDTVAVYYRLNIKKYYDKVGT